MKTCLLHAGQLASSFLRHIIAGEVAGAWQQVGGMRNMLTNLVRPLELLVIQNKETTSRFEKSSTRGLAPPNSRTGKYPSDMRRAGGSQPLSIEPMRTQPSFWVHGPDPPLGGCEYSATETRTIDAVDARPAT